MTFFLRVGVFEFVVIFSRVVLLMVFVSWFAAAVGWYIFLRVRVPRKPLTTSLRPNWLGEGFERVPRDVCIPTRSRTPARTERTRRRSSLIHKILFMLPEQAASGTTGLEI